MADAVVDRDKGALGAHGLLDGLAEELGALKQGTGLGRRQVRKGLVMGAGDEQAMALEERTIVEEGEKMLVLGKRVFGGFARNNLTEG